MKTITSLTIILMLLTRSSASCPLQCECVDQGTVSMTCLNVKMEGLPNTLNPQLERLVISRTNISHIESFFFASFPWLEMADLSENEVVEVQDNVWRESISLKTLSVAHNKIRIIPDFIGLESLTSLDLSYNQIQTLPRNILDTRLEELEVSNNLVTSLPPLPSSLQRLNVSNNKISSVSDVLSHLPHLLHLDLSHNPLLSLQSKDLGLVPDLLSLSLAWTGLVEVPSSSLLEVRGLLHLDLSHNNLTVLRSSALAGLEVLESLTVSHCPLLQTVETRIFGDKSLNMTLLDLSNNPRLSSLQPGSLAGLERLEKLLIQGNNLSSVVLPSSLQSVRAEDNPWRCDCDILHLARLDLPHTVLCHLPPNYQGRAVAEVRLTDCREEKERHTEIDIPDNNSLYFYCIVSAGLVSIIIILLIFCRKNLLRAATQLRWEDLIKYRSQDN